MIKTFTHSGLEDFFYDATLKGIQPKHATKLYAILELLDSAKVVQDMNFPGSRLHLLEPKQNNRWSVKVSRNWRITFVFEDGHAFDVNYEDYH